MNGSTVSAADRPWIGRSIRRTEDPTLLQGKGDYTDDINFPGQAHAVFARSQYGHGILRGVGTAAASAMPGVLAIYTQVDLENAGRGFLKQGRSFNNRDGSPMKAPERPVLARDKVRFVGEPIACVVAETIAQAKDAIEALELDIEPLPAVSDAAAAFAPGAPQLHESVPNNLALDFFYGDTAAVDAAFARAAKVIKVTPHNNRVVVAAMEPRAVVGRYDPAEERWILNVCSQGAFTMRGGIAGVLGVEPRKVRVLTGNVGGSFGMKSSVYPEYIAALHAAKALGRPVKWNGERAESFLSDSQGRGHDITLQVAFDKDGHILAIRTEGFANIGAYPVAPVQPTMNLVKNVIGVYRTPAIEVHTRVMYTNTGAVAAYRGAGRPEGNYYIERVLDLAAGELGIDRLEIRRRNHIAPDMIPHKAPSGMVYDSGEYRAVMDKALALSDWDGYPARKEASARAGKLRGRGLGSYLEVTAPPSNEMGGVRFEDDGAVTILTGTLDYGQGHAASYAQILCDLLGVPFDRVRLIQGDSDQLVTGNSTGGSRSMMTTGKALVEASAEVIARGKRLAAHVLETADADIEFRRGRFMVAGTDRGVDLIELARRVKLGKLPGDLPQTLDVNHISQDPPSSFPNGCHVAEVEIDPDTGVVSIARYSMVGDFGVVINPLLVEGQAHGGVAQGVGQALMEHCIYDGDGQMLSGSFMDYALPRATDLPMFTYATHAVPATTNPLGVKGCGEAGCAGALPSVMNAVVDALAPHGVRHIDMPVTSEKVWRAINTRT